MPLSPERKRQYMREYWRKNKEKRQAYNRAYWEKHKERERLRNKQWHAAHKEQIKIYNRNWRLRTLFGLTPEGYEELLKKQNGLCYICKQTNRRKTAHLPLAVDHNHTTNKLRGLLCNRCNLCLGWFEDHKTAILTYLRRGR